MSTTEEEYRVPTLQPGHYIDGGYYAGIVTANGVTLLGSTGFLQLDLIDAVRVGSLARDILEAQAAAQAEQAAAQEASSSATPESPQEPAEEPPGLYLVNELEESPDTTPEG